MTIKSFNCMKIDGLFVLELIIHHCLNPVYRQKCQLSLHFVEFRWIDAYDDVSKSASFSFVAAKNRMMR